MTAAACASRRPASVPSSPGRGCTDGFSFVSTRISACWSYVASAAA